MLGAAISEIDLEQEDGSTTKLVFSGDIGRSDMPILKDPTTVEGADFVIMEGTYGNRNHPPAQDAKQKLLELATRTFEEKGKLIIPAFSVGRTQEIVYRLNLLKESGQLPDIPVFVDSPLAVNATTVFRDKEHVECFDEEMIKQIIEEEDSDPLAFENLHYIRKVEYSIQLNTFKDPAIIISASGMCESGRILHHLKNHISKPNTTVLFTGYQAPHTLGRRILEGRDEVRIYGEPVAVRARVEKLEASSGHADQNGLLDWATAMAEKGNVKKIALVHCELDSGGEFEKLLEEKGIASFLPERGEAMSLDHTRYQ